MKKTYSLGFLCLMLLATGMPGGCLSRPSLVRQDFTFGTPSQEVVAAAPARGRVLSLRRLMVAAPFAGQSFVYRTGESSYEPDPYAQFLVPPADSLAEPVLSGFRRAGVFSAVAENGSAIKADTRVEVSVSQLYGDFRNRSAPAAVLAMRFVFLADDNELMDRFLQERSYSRRIPIQARTATAVMAGWNEALQQIMQEVNSSPLPGAARPSVELSPSMQRRDDDRGLPGS